MHVKKMEGDFEHDEDFRALVDNYFVEQPVATSSVERSAIEEDEDDEEDEKIYATLQNVSGEINYENVFPSTSGLDEVSSTSQSRSSETAADENVDAVDFDRSVEDIAETVDVEKMYGADKTQCCMLRCNFSISQSLAQHFRDSFHELEKSEQDLVILAHLEANKQHLSLTDAYEKMYTRKSKVRASLPKVRAKIQYYFRGLQICPEMYFFIHPMSKTR